MLKKCPLFQGITAIGLVSSHPSACHVLSKYTCMWFSHQMQYSLMFATQLLHLRLTSDYTQTQTLSRTHSCYNTCYIPCTLRQTLDPNTSWTSHTMAYAKSPFLHFTIWHTLLTCFSHYPIITDYLHYPLPYLSCLYHKCCGVENPALCLTLNSIILS